MHNELTMAKHKLNGEELLEHAKLATRIRRTISQKVRDSNEERKSSEVESEQEYIDISLTESFNQSMNIPEDFTVKNNPSHPRTKRLTLNSINASTRTKIVKMAVS